MTTADKRTVASWVTTAAKEGNYSLLNALIKNGADVNKTEGTQMSPLSTAIENKHWRCARLLIRAGANVNYLDRYGYTCLGKAAVYDPNGKCINMLLKAGAEVYYNGYQATVGAIKHRNIRALERLLRAGACINLCDFQNNTPLLVSAQRLLAVPKSDLDKENNEYHIMFIKMLLEAEAEVNARNESHQTALILAVEAKEIDSIEILLKYNAYVNHSNLFRRTALMQAVECFGPTHLCADNANLYSYDNVTDQVDLMIRSHHCTQKLIEAGAILDMLDSYNKTALILATIQGNYMCVKLLLRSGAQVNIGDNSSIQNFRNIDMIGDNLHKKALAAVFAAGERLTDVPYYLQDFEPSLQSMCRTTIREALLNVDPFLNLFHRISQLPLPKLIHDYLLYDQSIEFDYTDLEYWHQD